MMDALLSVLVGGTVLLAVLVDLTVLDGWCWGAWRLPLALRRKQRSATRKGAGAFSGTVRRIPPVAIL
jgi:hypothetical protein